MNALWQKIQEMREEHRARHNVYWEEQQAWQKQHQEERRQKCAPCPDSESMKSAEAKQYIAVSCGVPMSLQWLWGSYVNASAVLIGASVCCR